MMVAAASLLRDIGTVEPRSRHGAYPRCSHTKKLRMLSLPLKRERADPRRLGMTD